MKAHAVSEGGDPTSAKLPSKTKLAESLADVAKRTHYQPKEIRRLYDKLLDLVETRRESMGLVRSGVNRCGFIINASLADEWRIKGRITLTKVPDLWLFDLDRLVAERLVEKIVAGPPCWDHEGKRIVFSVNPTHNVRNNEVIRIYDFDNGLSEERLRIGHYLCWDKDGRIYGNSLQAHGYQIQAIDRSKKNYRRVLPLPNGSILASVDRENYRRRNGVRP
jgi:hypothetical protein